jgi:hypothetical protein
MKVLIIGDDWQLIQLFETRCKELGFSEIVSCPHSKALVTFELADPSHIVINEYDENREGKGEGTDTWFSLLSLNCIDNQKVVLSGHDCYNIPCYIKLPFDLLEFRRLLLGF